ncbi:unnamed protein product [Closterium sp. NIES-65]|nr:unnamed protein product [Closterium sp. NIES-65]
MATPSVLAFDAEGRAIDFEWATRDAAARLAVRRHLPTSERAHFSQYKSAQTLYDAIVARYSSPATAALSRLMLPFLFLDLAAFPTVADLITHLRTSDTRYRAALPADFCAKNPPPMYITLYFLVTSLPDSLRVVRDHFLAVCPTTLTVDSLEKALLAAEKSIVAVGASQVRRLPLAGDAALARARGARERVGLAGAVAVEVEAAEGVGVAVEEVAGVRVLVVAMEAEAASVAAVLAEVAAVAEVEEVEVEVVEVVGSGTSQRSGTGGGQRQQHQQRSRDVPTPQQLREWYTQRQRGGGLGPCTYVLRTSDRGGCFPPDPGIETVALGTGEAAALGACDAAALGAGVSASSGTGESALSGTTSASASHTFTLDSGASRSFFRDCTTLNAA